MYPWEYDWNISWECSVNMLGIIVYVYIYIYIYIYVYICNGSSLKRPRLLPSNNGVTRCNGATTRVMEKFSVEPMVEIEYVVFLGQASYF